LALGVEHEQLERLMKILVAGGFDADDREQEERVRGFCEALGCAVAENNHVLLNGCRTKLDELVVEATHRGLTDGGIKDADKRIVSYVLAGHQPVHQRGTILKSRLTDWDIAKATFYIPEQVQQADAVILAGGFEGTYRAANWARIANKPLLPFTAFGGAAQEIYEQELDRFAERYEGLVERLEYEQLNAVKQDWRDHATDLVALAEKVAVSRRVLVIMSYASRPELDDAYESFEQVTKELGYRCTRVTEANASERILPDILDRIQRAAFTVVDLTDLRPNVFYELGYADGLGKKVVVTAKSGTELPFDVKDIPTIMWDGQKQLKEDLRARIMEIMPTVIPSASPPIGTS
jgi:hypothetical protein